ncbi:uncharacterized protein isoform X2 [Rhodnius prolixus]
MRPKKQKSNLTSESTKNTTFSKEEISLQYLKTLEGTKIRRTYSSKSDKNLVKKENLKKVLELNVDKNESDVQDPLTGDSKSESETNGTVGLESECNVELNRQYQCSNCKSFFKSTGGLRRHEVSCNSTSNANGKLGRSRKKVSIKIKEASQTTIICTDTPVGLKTLNGQINNDNSSNEEPIIISKNPSAVDRLKEYDFVEASNQTSSVTSSIVSSNVEVNGTIFEDVVGALTSKEVNCTNSNLLALSSQADAGPPTENVDLIGNIIIKEEDEINENNLDVRYKCMHCDNVYKTFRGMRRHESNCKKKSLYRQAASTDADEAVLSETTFNSSDPLTLNNDDVDETKCHCCGEDKETAHTSGDFECKQCSKLFRLKSSLDRHARVVHNGFSHECPQCGAKCPDKGTLARHMYTHTGLKPYSCPICKQEFSRKYHLVRHNMQTGCDGKERPVFPCQVCGREFNRKDNLREHLRAHAGQTKRKKKYTCGCCGIECEATDILKLHKKIHNGERQYTCEFCHKKFPSSGSLKKHRRTHTGEKPYECLTCHRRFAAKETLNRHVRLHTGYKPHCCPFCGKRFIQGTQLKAHLYYHTGEAGMPPIESFVCEICGKNFNRKARLNEHVKFVHLGAKPFQCGQCTKTFIRKEDLNRHRIIHSGIRAHQCPICSKAFTMKSSLKVHLLTHTKEPPTSCDECGRAFIRQDCLLRHMKTKHREMLEEIKSEAEKKKLQQQLLQVAAEASLVEGMEEREELDENGLVDAVRELLTLLVDETTLRGLGWPGAGVEALLEAVIRRCGHEPAPSSTPRHDRLRHNIKLLFTVVIDDSAVKALLNNQTVDEVILHVLRLAKT